MKNLLFIVLILIGIESSFGQGVPNLGFENWHPYASGEYPDFWTTSDSVAVALGGGNNVTKGTDFFEGQYCLHLKSVNTPLGIKGPGVATNGIIKLSGTSFIFNGGSADTMRWEFFSGEYKYLRFGANDAAVVSVFLLRDTSGVKDTIASGVLLITDSTASYSPFVVPLQYRIYDRNPDTCLVILQSSRAINDPGLAPGSEFIVDSLNFSGFVGIEELKNNITSVNIYPSPANQQISLEVELKSKMDLTYEIYDLNGKLIQQAKLKSTKEIIDVSSISAGKYILKLGDANRNTLLSKNFSIAR